MSFRYYVVRIYRQEKGRPRELVGIVEDIAKRDKRTAFTNIEELWSILKQRKAKTDLRRRHSPEGK